MVRVTKSRGNEHMQFTATIDAGDLYKNMTYAVRNHKKAIGKGLEVAVQYGIASTQDFIVDSYRSPSGQVNRDDILMNRLLEGFRVTSGNQNNKFKITSTARTSDGVDMAPIINFGTKKNYLTGGVLIPLKENSDKFMKDTAKKQELKSGATGDEFLLPRIRHPGRKSLDYMSHFEDFMAEYGPGIVIAASLSNYWRTAGMPAELKGMAKASFNRFQRIAKSIKTSAPRVMATDIKMPKANRTWSQIEQDMIDASRAARRSMIPQRKTRPATPRTGLKETLKRYQPRGGQ